MSGKALCEFGFKAHPAKHNREQVEEENTGQAGDLPPWTPHTRTRSREDFCAFREAAYLCPNQTTLETGRGSYSFTYFVHEVLIYSVSIQEQRGYDEVSGA